LAGLHQNIFEEVPGSMTDHISIKSPYRCLDSILPHLNGLLSAEEASEMLEIYFNEKHNSLFKSTSPYLLAHVLHPSSVLHPTDPRPTSAALLAVILFCVAQTADMKIFDTPGARERMSVDLYRLSLDLLQPEDPDNYFRTSGKHAIHRINAEAFADSQQTAGNSTPIPAAARQVIHTQPQIDKRAARPYYRDNSAPPIRFSPLRS
jgi:hypothetical protein